MEKSALAILTFNRIKTLEAFLESIKKHVDPETHVAVFEDCGYMDTTRSTIESQATLTGYSPELDADIYERDGVTFHLARHNLGVAANTNRALLWAMNLKAPHIVVANDDLVCSGDFVAEYKKAHQKTGLGMFCFNDFDAPQHKWARVFYRGVELKLFPRMTGICISLIRPVVDTIGYYDVRVGKFGEEHCEYTNRARMCSFLDCDRQPQPCLDIQDISLAHQEVASSINPDEKPFLDQAASVNLQKVHAELMTYGKVYRPFELINSEFVGAFGGLGFRASSLPYAKIVTLGL